MHITKTRYEVVLWRNLRRFYPKRETKMKYHDTPGLPYRSSPVTIFLHALRAQVAVGGCCPSPLAGLEEYIGKMQWKMLSRWQVPRQMTWRSDMHWVLPRVHNLQMCCRKLKTMHQDSSATSISQSNTPYQISQSLEPDCSGRGWWGFRFINLFLILQLQQ